MPPRDKGYKDLHSAIIIAKRTIHPTIANNNYTMTNRSETFLI